MYVNGGLVLDLKPFSSARQLWPWVKGTVVHLAVSSVTDRISTAMNFQGIGLEPEFGFVMSLE